MKVGSLVECVMDFSKSSVSYEDCPNRPIVGKQYIIRDIVDWPNGVFVRLEEIINPVPLGYAWEATFTIDGFRELMPPMEDVEEWINSNSLEYA